MTAQLTIRIPRKGQRQVYRSILRSPCVTTRERERERDRGREKERKKKHMILCSKETFENCERKTQLVDDLRRGTSDSSYFSIRKNMLVRHSGLD